MLRLVSALKEFRLGLILAMVDSAPPGAFDGHLDRRTSEAHAALLEREWAAVSPSRPPAES